MLPRFTLNCTAAISTRISANASLIRFSDELRLQRQDFKLRRADRPASIRVAASSICTQSIGLFLTRKSISAVAANISSGRIDRSRARLPVTL